MKKFVSRAVVVAMSLMMMTSMTGCDTKKYVHRISGVLYNVTSEGEGTEIEVDDKMEMIQNYIDDYFYFEEDKEKVEDGVYAGMVAGLDDPYSQYFNPEEYQQMIEDNSGTYVGIGVQVTQDTETGKVTATKVFKGSPAEKAGILKGDVFLQVSDYELTATSDLDEVVTYIRGEEGTDVTVKIYRPSISDSIEFTMTRASVSNYTVEYEMLPDQIGYVQVTQFDEVTGKEYIKAVEALKAQGMKALVIDLRDNPGGLLSVVNSMLDYMLPQGSLIVYTEDKNGNRVASYNAETEEYFTLPLVVLVNGNSASASEIFTGAIKDYGIGTIVGTKTFGKGIVQSVFPLGDGSAIKLTVEKYFTPSGYDLHGKGIEPDVEVELDEELQTQSDIEHSKDNQLQEGIKILKEKMK